MLNTIQDYAFKVFRTIGGEYGNTLPVFQLAPMIATLQLNKIQTTRAGLKAIDSKV